MSVRSSKNCARPTRRRAPAWAGLQASRGLIGLSARPPATLVAAAVAEALPAGSADGLILALRPVALEAWPARRPLCVARAMAVSVAVPVPVANARTHAVAIAAEPTVAVATRQDVTGSEVGNRARI